MDDTSKSPRNYKFNKNSPDEVVLEKINEKDMVIQGLITENKILKGNNDANLKEIKFLKETIERLTSETINNEETAKNSEKTETDEPKITIIKEFHRGVTKNLDSLSPERELRKDISNSETIIETFFRKLHSQIAAKSYSLKDFESQVDPQQKGIIDFQDLYQNLIKYNYSFSAYEMKTIHEALSKKLNSNFVSMELVLNNLNKYHMDSDRSYDISSESSNSDRNCTKVTAAQIDNVKELDILPQANYLYIVLCFHEFTKQTFEVFIRDHLPEQVDLEVLAAVFMHKYLRIEDGVDRNKICSFLLQGKKTVNKEVVVSKLVKLIFQNDVENNIKAEKFKIIISKIRNKSDEFLELCEQKDENLKEFLSWNEIESIIKTMNIETDVVGLNELKKKCYAIEKSLNIIPYKKIID